MVDKIEILKQFKELSDVVKLTMGPNGQTIMYVNSAGTTVTTADGATVVNNYPIGRTIEGDLGIALLKEASNRTMELAGDSTSTTTLLSYLLCAEVHAGAIEYPEDLEVLRTKFLNALERHKIETTRDNIIKLLNTTSHNNHMLVAEFMKHHDDIISDMPVIIKKSKWEKDVTEVRVEIDDGYLVESRAVNSAFVYNHANKVTAVVLLNEKLTNIGTASTLRKSLQEFNKSINKPDITHMVIMSHDVDRSGFIDALMESNKTQKIKVTPIVMPGATKDVSQALMKDISVLLGVGIQTKETIRSRKGRSLFGFIDGYATSTDKCLFNIKPKMITEHVKVLGEQLLKETKQSHRELLIKRINLLKCRQISVTCLGVSDANLNELYHNAEDVVSVLTRVKNNGMVPGLYYPFVKEGLLTEQGTDELVRNLVRVSRYDDAEKLLENLRSDIITDLRTNEKRPVTESAVVDSYLGMKEAVINSFELARMYINLGGIIV